jgi:hypothetical protein
VLPITSPFDTYRAGLWAVRKNLRLVVGYIALVTAGSFLLWAADAESLLFGMGTGAGLVLSLLMLVAACMIPAILIYPLHATFLSDGRVKGLAAIESLGRLWRIGWRLFVIAALALIPSLIVIFPLMLGVIVRAAGPEGGEAAMADWYVLAAFAIGVLFFGISIILFGPHIPDIVTGNDARPGPSSFQRGTRHFWRMAANLAAGPGLVMLVYEVPSWLVVASLAAELDGIAFAPVQIADEFAGTCVMAFCSAMTAGVLSDAYRRALASEAEA